MSKQIKADLFLFTITVIWGSSFTLMKNVLACLPAFAYLSLRFIIATVVLILVFNKKLRFLNRKVILSGCLIGLMLFGVMAFQVIGLHYTTASNSAFITGLNVVMVPLISAVFLKKNPRINAIIGVILAFSGLFVLTGGINTDFNKGDLLTFFCAICCALQIILIDKFTNDQDPALLGLIQIGFAAFLYSILWVAVDRKPIEINLAVIITLLITGVLGTSLAFAGQTIVQRFTSPTRTALILTGEPVFGAFFAILIPNSLGITESLSINSLIGCFMILTGMVISEIKFKSKEKDEPF